MFAKLRPFALPLILAVLAVFIYNKKIRHEMADFAVYRQAAARSLHGEPLYRPEDGHYQFKYLPAYAMAMAPFALMNVETAKMAWFALSIGFMAAFLRWSVAALPARRLSERTLMWLIIVLMAKFLAHELTLGQTNLLLGVLLVGSLLAIQIDKPIIAGVLIGLAVFVKPYAVVVLPWLLVTQGVFATAVAGGVVVTGLLLPVALYGWAGNLAQLASWYHTVTDSTAPNLLVSDNISLAAMWAKWIGVGPAATALAAASGAAVLALVVVAWRGRQRIAEPDYLEFALLMLLVPLLSPQGWDYVLLLSAPAVLCVVDRARELPAVEKWSLTAAVVIMCLSIFDIMGRTLYGRFMALSIVSVCALVIAVGLVGLRRRNLV